jgi:hypothetical protein
MFSIYSQKLATARLKQTQFKWNKLSRGKMIKADHWEKQKEHFKVECNIEWSPVFEVYYVRTFEEVVLVPHSDNFLSIHWQIYITISILMFSSLNFCFNIKNKNVMKYVTSLLGNAF